MATSFFQKFQPQFAAYFNLARQNAYISLCQISRIIGIDEPVNKESQLHQMKVISQLTKVRPEIREYLIRQLYRRFPFLKVMVSCEQMSSKSKVVTPEMVYRVFYNLFQILNYERDRASHHIFVDKRTENAEYIEAEKKVAQYLNHCFTAAMRMVRARFELDAKQMEFITQERYKMIGTDKKDKKGRWIKKPRINTDFVYAILNDGERLSDMGRVFLICQFIEKRYATMFFDALQERNSKQSFFYMKYGEIQRKIVREVFSVYRIPLFRERLDNEREDTALALDMLNELKKCPAELFEHISQKNQEKFRIISAVGDDEVLQKRSADRFAELALRYIDERKLLQKIRFQVNFGKYRYCLKEDKQCIDGLTRIRVLQKELNGFGRLGDVEKLRTGQDGNKSWNGVDLLRAYEDVTRDEVADFPYITDCRTQYLFNGERIGLAFRTKQQDPYLDSYGNYMPSIGENHQVVSIQPTCWLSLYELPALVFHTHLCGNGEAAECIIRDCVARYRNFFNCVREGTVEKIRCADNKEPRPEEYRSLEEHYGIVWGNIPDKIRDYLVGRTRSNFDCYAGEIIDRMISQTEAMIRKFKEDMAVVGTKDNKIGKKSYVDIRTGRLAVFLARDIVFFQPSKLIGEQKGQDKPTGLNYRIMQASIAMYDVCHGDQSLEQFTQMFASAGIIGSSNKHPFLKSVLDQRPRNTVEFYEFYLVARLNKLREIKKSRSYKETYFLHEDRKKWAVRNKVYYQDLAARYLKQPIELPRGLFGTDIKVRLLKLCEENEKLVAFKAALEKQRCNVAYMVLSYLHYIRQDEAQAFYSFKRCYKITELLHGEKIYSSLEDYQKYNFKKEIEHRVNNLTITEKNKWGKPTGKLRNATFAEKEIERRRLRKYFNEYDDNERLLRRYKVQDILLFFMAKSILGETVSHFKLGKIPGEEGSILELRIPFSLTITVKNGDERKTIEIHQDAIKIKNYGDFFRFLYDDRVKSLLPQIESVKLNREVLEEELLKYDIVRPQIFDLILRFERSITSKNPDLINTRHGFKDLLQVISDLSDRDKEDIRVVRNAFGHNFYPQINDMKDCNIPRVAIEIEKMLNRKINTINK